MDQLIQIFSANKIIVAAANLFGIIAGLFLIWKIISAITRFSIDIYNSDIRIAIHRHRKRMVKTSFLCAVDIYYYLSFLFSRLIIMIVLSFGMMISAITENDSVNSRLLETYLEQNLISDFDLYVTVSKSVHRFYLFTYLILFAYMVLRTQNVTLNVRRLRMRWRRRGRIT
jgi:hypothetical protein